MSERYPGGYITKNAPQPTGGESGTAPGVWTLEEAAEYQKAGTWPAPYIPKYVEDVFSTYLYTGNSSVQTINNGIGLGSSYGGRVFFNGTGGYLNVNNSSAFGFATNDFTAECWIYPLSVPSTYVGIFGTLNVTTPVGFTLCTNSSGNITFSFNSASGSTFDSNSTATKWVANTWQHIAITRSSNSVRIFLNGTQIGTTKTNSADLGSSDDFVIGRIYTDFNNYYFNGYISNVRIVKGNAVYTSNFTPPTSPLTAISGTSLLTCQTPNTTLDYSSNNFTITANETIEQNGGGPFIDSTANQGGMVWIKTRNVVDSNYLFDTNRGTGYYLTTNTANTQGGGGGTTTLNSFNSNGFSLGSSGGINGNGENLVSWTFRKQAKFFDVVTYTGTGTPRTVAHNLGSTPGFILIKRLNLADAWQVYHRSTGAGYVGFMGTGVFTADSTVWNNTEPTSSVFTVGTEGRVNANGGTYVAYLFAHNAGGFGSTGSDNIISCGSYVGGSADLQTITTNLGYEPQWVLIKSSDRTNSNWTIIDNIRGTRLQSDNYPYFQQLRPNSDIAEENAFSATFNSTGLQFLSANHDVCGSNSNTYVYVAIRRGPMKTPQTGTTVFSPQTSSSGVGTKLTTNFPVDAQIVHYRTGTDGVWWIDRLRGVNSPGLATSLPYLLSNNTNAESNALGSRAWDNTGFQIPSLFASASYVYWNFGRAPGFFDIVCYTGTGVARTINHNLGVAPELIIVKRRSNVSNWPVYSAPSGNTNYQYINTNSAVDTFNYWNNTSPTSTVFSVGTDNDVNASGNTYVSYLFASCPGVSKVGSYTGSGTTKQIDCGFTSGARFVMIKRTSSIGDWFVWDSARGIVAGNDPYVLMNSSDAEVTGTDYVDTYSAGFEISSTAPATINAAGATFIYLAIA